MKNSLLSLALVPVFAAVTALAQAPQPAPANAAPPPAELPEPKEDFKPAPSNQAGREYPQVNSERRIRYRIVAPQATSISIGQTTLTKGDDGVWTGVSRPADEGFHYNSMRINGVDVPEPNSRYYYGSSRWGSAIEIPAADQDFYALKNVPHGQLREIHYFAKSSNSVRHIYVIRHPTTTKTPASVIPCSICSMARAKTKPAGAPRGAPA